MSIRVPHTLLQWTRSTQGRQWRVKEFTTDHGNLMLYFGMILQFVSIYPVGESDDVFAQNLNV